MKMLKMVFIGLLCLLGVLYIGGCYKIPNGGSGNGNIGVKAIKWKEVDIQLTGDEAIEWMKNNGYTISGGKGYVIIRGDSIKSISAGAFYSGKLYDKNNEVVGSLIVSGGEISINITREGTIDD